MHLTQEMAEAHSCTLLVTANEKGEKTLQHDGSMVPTELCQQSETLRELLDTCGLVTLPMSPTLFERWIQFASAQKTDVGTGRDDDYCVATLAGLIEVSQFMCNTAIEAAAASRMVRLLRRFFREDVLAGIRISTSIHNTNKALHFPPDVPASAGPRLSVGISCLPPLPAATAAAVVRHLSLTEAILLPPPFPGQALAHFLETTGGVLDLSPPRVPVHTPEGLINMTQKLVPLLAAAPPVTALHIAAPCLSSHSAAAPLLPHLSAVTRLCITHGKVGYADLRSPCHIANSTAVPLLAAVSPTSLRHLSIDAEVDLKSALVHYLLSTFTGLTSLRLQKLCRPDALRMMPRLESLCVPSVAMPAGTSLACSQAQLAVEESPQLRHMHVSGDLQGVSDLYNGFCSRLREAEGSGGEAGAGAEVGQLLRPEIPPVLAPITDVDGEDEDMDGNEILCCGFPGVPEAASLLRNRTARIGTVSTVYHFFTFPMIRHAWGPDAVGRVQGGTDGSAHTQAVQQLQELTLAMKAKTITFDVLLWRLLAGEVPNALRTLCVLAAEGIAPQSPVSAKRTKRAGLWVTAQPSGVAHPLCALEMLHYSGAPHTSEPCGHSGCLNSLGEPSGCAPARTGFDTLRLPFHYFGLFEELVSKGAPSCTGVRDLSIHCRLDVHVDLSPLTLLPHLRTLCLEGMDIKSLTACEGALPPSLTALRVHSTVTAPEDAGALGCHLQELRRLQCLDIELAAALPSPPADPRDRCVAKYMAVERVKRELWRGLETALVRLPLHLGATISVDSV